MAGRGGGKKRGRPSAKQASPPPQAEEEGSEYVPGDESGRDSPEDEAVSARIESRPKRTGQQKGKEPVPDKGKRLEKLPVSAHGDEQHTYTRGKKQSRGISINEPTTEASQQDPPQSIPQDDPTPIDPKRVRMYASKNCVGERFVGVENLIRKAPGFRALFETGNLREICDFPDPTGYGVELIREFYMRGGHLVETDGGPYQFTTSVRGVHMAITPELIGHVLEMPAFTGGVDYMKAGLDSVKDWKRVLTALCIEDAENNGVAILSKDLRAEYRFLNFVVCYNIMPLANTKVIRWDRVLYMYLLGRPNLIQEKNLNMNIPFLIWKRMARELKTANQKDRLPFPLIIMRILRFHDVDVTCSSYEYPLGPIGDTTIIKSRAQLYGSEKPPPEPPAPASPAHTEASISMVYSEQQRLSGELERLASGQAQLVSDVARLNKKYGKISRFLHLICTKLGCGSSEIPPLDTDSD